MNSDKCLVYSTRRVVRGKRTYVGGFADRIKGVITTYLLAVMTGRRFRMNWEWPASLDTVLAPADYDWRLAEPWVEEDSVVFDLIDAQVTPEKLTPMRTGGAALNEYLADAERVTVFCNGFFYRDLRACTVELEQHGVDMSSTPAAFRSCFDTLFRFRPMGDNIERYMRFRRFRESVPVVYGAQFRTGGKGDWKDPMLDRPENVTLLAGQLLQHARAHHPDGFGIFLTTDSQEAKQRLQDALPADIPLFFYEDEPAHLDRSPEPEARRVSDQLVVEHTALSECEMIFVGKGAFGRTAAYRAGKQPIIYEPLGA